MSSSKVFGWRYGVAGLVVCLGVICLAGGPAAAAVSETAAGESVGASLAQVPDAGGIRERWGIEVVSLRPTANGHMLDFRYRVVNAEKAAPLFKRQMKPHLIHHASEKVLAVPVTAKLGALRNSNTPKEGRTYWMFFGNPGGMVKSGDKVTVEIGGFKANELTVQ